MDEFADKLILLAFCLLLLPDSGEEASIIAFLTAVITAAFGFYIEEKKWICLLTGSVFFLAFWQPVTLIFFPLLLYDLISWKLYVWIFPFLILFASFQSIERRIIALWIFTAALSILLSCKTEKKRTLNENLIRIRDNSTELNMTLMEKNKALLEKQDHEIYLATQRERNRIAREIHDNVGHMLSRSLLMTGALLTVEKNNDTHNRLLDMKDTLNLAMDSIRQSVHDLHDDSIDLNHALWEAAKPLLEDFEVKIEYDMSNNVPKNVKYCLIAITKEAVSNILKHSNGNAVRMNFQEHPGFFQLSISDNGTNIKAKHGQGIGLQNMKDRADSLNGIFRTHTKDGFAVFLTIPKTEELLCG